GMSHAKLRFRETSDEMARLIGLSCERKTLRSGASSAADVTRTSNPQGEISRVDSSNLTNNNVTRDGAIDPHPLRFRHRLQRVEIGVRVTSSKPGRPRLKHLIGRGRTARLLVRRIQIKNDAIAPHRLPFRRHPQPAAINRVRLNSNNRPGLRIE